LLLAKAWASRNSENESRFEGRLEATAFPAPIKLSTSVGRFALGRQRKSGNRLSLSFVFASKEKRDEESSASDVAGATPDTCCSSTVNAMPPPVIRLSSAERSVVYHMPRFITN
jgi:hypothetical protein